MGFCNVRRPRDAAITASIIIAHVSGSTIDLKLKLRTKVQCGERLMRIGTVDSRYGGSRYSTRTPQ